MRHLGIYIHLYLYNIFRVCLPVLSLSLSLAVAAALTIPLCVAYKPGPGDPCKPKFRRQGFGGWGGGIRTVHSDS